MSPVPTGAPPRLSPARCCPHYLVIFIEDGGRHAAGDDLAEDGGLPARLLAGCRCPLRFAHLPVLPAGRRHAPLRQRHMGPYGLGHPRTGTLRWQRHARGTGVLGCVMGWI